MNKVCRRDCGRLFGEAGLIFRNIGGHVLGGAGLAFVGFAALSPARAESLVVVEARGIASTAGSLIDSKNHLTLRPGEHVRLIGENGNQYCLDGPYDGPAKPLLAQSRAAPGSRWSLWNSGEGDQADPLTDCMQ